ncbi:MAG: SDR family oxidoreductase [Caldilineae bacterium]|nr:MAG: SDR family oxidoreductase [Caldilineae bacterium]
MAASPQPLQDRVALVTGAARGIGQATARALASAGARVGLLDLDAAALDETISALSGLGLTDRIMALPADVSQSDEVGAAVDRIVLQFGGLHILVNNAGICPLSAFDRISEEEWDLVLAVNLKGPFLLCQAALPYLRAAGRRGRIINIASVAGEMGGLLVGAHYAASKAGLIGLSKSLARLLAPYGVTVNCIAPGTAETDLTAAWGEELRDRVREQIPLGRLATTEEIAAAVCYLASDEAAFITGATLDINGGLFMR